MFDYWFKKHTFVQPSLWKAVLLAPLIVIIANPIMLMLVDSSPGGAGNVLHNLSGVILVGTAIAYPMGVIGCLIVGWPFYALLQRFSFQCGAIYPVAGFIAGTYLAQILLSLYLAVVLILNLEYHDAPTWSQLLDDLFTKPTPLMGANAALVAGLFFWLLVKSDKSAVVKEDNEAEGAE